MLNNIPLDTPLHVPLLISTCRGGDSHNDDEKGLKAANIVKDANGKWIMKIMPTDKDINNNNYTPTNEEFDKAASTVIEVKTMKISLAHQHKFTFNDPNLSVCGFICWYMDNTDARKKNTAFPYNIYPGLTFCVPLPKRKAVHYRCCQKVFDKNSPSD